MKVMTEKGSKSKRGRQFRPERHARPGSDYGLVRRVAKKLGKSEALVSGVKRGSIPVHGPEMQRVADALEEERARMRREEEQRAANPVA